jgi:hypothetical protein
MHFTTLFITCFALLGLSGQAMVVPASVGALTSCPKVTMTVNTGSSVRLSDKTTMKYKGPAGLTVTAFIHDLTEKTLDYKRNFTLDSNGEYTYLATLASTANDKHTYRWSVAYFPTGDPVRFKCWIHSPKFTINSNPKPGDPRCVGFKLIKPNSSFEIKAGKSFNVSYTPGGAKTPHQIYLSQQSTSSNFASWSIGEWVKSYGKDADGVITVGYKYPADVQTGKNYMVVLYATEPKFPLDARTEQMGCYSASSTVVAR